MERILCLNCVCILIVSGGVGVFSVFYYVGWVCTRHDRHDRWPIIEEENWEDECVIEHTLNPTISSDSERSSDRFFVYVEETDSSITTDDDILYMGDSGKRTTLYQDY